MDIALVSIGKISLTVRYALDEPAEAKKNTMHQHTVNQTASRCPPANKSAVIIKRMPLPMNVPEIIGLRPTESKKWPRRIGPAKFPMAIGRSAHGATSSGIPRSSVSTRYR